MSPTSASTSAGCFVGRPRQNTSATNASTASTESDARSPFEAGGGVLVDDGVGRRAGDAGIVERGLEVGVGDEGHARRQLHLGLSR